MADGPRGVCGTDSRYNSRLSAHGHDEQLSHQLQVRTVLLCLLSLNNACAAQFIIHSFTGATFLGSFLPFLFHLLSHFSSTSSDITLLYNDRSVLENFHISEAFKVMRKDESNIIQNLSREEYRYDHVCAYLK